MAHWRNQAQHFIRGSTPQLGYLRQPTLRVPLTTPWMAKREELKILQCSQSSIIGP